MKQKIRIAAGQGFWGDLPDAPVRQVEGGPIDYLMLDYLAEVTMSIMQKQKARDPNAGYAKDFVPLMRRILPACVERGIKVTANAGGVNVRGCADAVIEGVIKSFNFGGVLLDDKGRARIFEVTVAAAVTVRDQTENRVLYDNQNFVFRGEYEFASDPRSFFNEEDPAILRMSRSFAESIVSTLINAVEIGKK